jgi:uncharacterized Zn finger protein
MSEHSVQCGECRVDAELIQEDDGTEEVRCPSCGKTASQEQAVESAEQYALSAVEGMFDDSMREATRGSKVMTYESNRKPPRKYEWILGGI